VRGQTGGAARYRLGAEIVVDARGTVRPVRRAIIDLAEDLAPIV